MALLPAACRLDAGLLLNETGSCGESNSRWSGRTPKGTPDEGTLNTSGCFVDSMGLSSSGCTRENAFSSGAPSGQRECPTPEPELLSGAEGSEAPEYPQLLSAPDSEVGEQEEPDLLSAPETEPTGEALERTVPQPSLAPKMSWNSPSLEDFQRESTSCTTCSTPAEEPSKPPSSQRPCDHNTWDDVRTRRHAKMLRCRVCQAKWRLPSTSVPRCRAFFRWALRPRQ